MPATGVECKVTGIYVSNCDDRTEVAVEKDRGFPACERHGEVMWTLVRAALS